MFGPYVHPADESRKVKQIIPTSINYHRAQVLLFLACDFEVYGLFEISPRASQT